MSSPRGVRRDVATYALATFVPALLGFAGVVLLVRLLGEEGFGRVSVVMGAALMTAAYASGWLGQGVLRFHAGARTSGDGDSLGATALALQLRALLVLIPLLLAWLLLTPQLSAGARLAGLMLCAGAALYQLRLAHAQADFRPGDVMRGETVRSAAIPAAALVAAGAFHGAPAAALATIAAGYALAWLLLRRDDGPSAFQPTLARQLWSYGWPIGLWLGFSQLLAFLDRYVIALFHGYEAAGRYSAGFELVRRGLVLALAPVTLAAHPALVARWTGGDRAGAGRLWRRALLLQGVAGAVLVAAYVPLAARVQVLAFGFGLAWPVNLAMAISGAVWAIALMAHKPLELQLRTRTMLAALAVAAALNVAGNFLLVPRHGFAAAAWVSAASAALYLAVVLSLAARSGLRFEVL